MDDMPFTELRAAIKQLGGFHSLPSYARYVQLQDDFYAMCALRRWLSSRKRREVEAAWQQVVQELGGVIGG